MAEDLWYPFDNGATLGHEGSEQGIILRDEEHPSEARITLERDGSIAPFVITCGIYGCMMHTRFFTLEAGASSQYDQMKTALSDLLVAAYDGSQEKRRLFLDAVAAFVERFP
jgi:hypothetical protein